MPTKKSSGGYVKKYNKRKFKPKKKYVKPTSIVVKTPSIVPDRLFVKLKYQERISLSNTTGALSSYLFSGNSIYDPNHTGTGAQPAGFDQWAAFYNRYTVRGSKMSVQFANVQTTNAAAAVENVLVAVNDTTGYTDLDAASANPYMRRTLYTPTNGFPVLKSFMSTKKIVGQRMVDDDTYGSAVTTSPVDQWYWQILSLPVDRLSSLTQYAYVTIVYYVEFHDRKQLNLS